MSTSPLTTAEVVERPTALAPPPVRRPCRQLTPATSRLKTMILNKLPKSSV